MSATSTKPYLLRAIYEWCTDNHYTPHIAVAVDSHTQVPSQYITEKGQTILNISFIATQALKMDNEWISFSTRFNGVSHDISIPVSQVIAIYAKENNQGMSFEVDASPSRDKNIGSSSSKQSAPLQTLSSSQHKKPTIVRIK